MAAEGETVTAAVVVVVVVDRDDDDDAVGATVPVTAEVTRVKVVRPDICSCP